MPEPISVTYLEMKKSKFVWLFFLEIETRPISVF